MRSRPPHLEVVPSDQPSESSLLLGVQARDPAMLSAFFSRFEGLVNRVVWRVLGADANHDDVVNQALDTVVKRIGDVLVPESLEGWVRRVAVNAARMELRRRRWRSFFFRSIDETAALSHPDLTIPDEAERERVRMLYRALEGLPVDERTMLVLRHLEGLELTEVASAMDCSLATAKRRLSRAEARLAARLGVTS